MICSSKTIHSIISPLKPKVFILNVKERQPFTHPVPYANGWLSLRIVVFMSFNLLTVLSLKDTYIPNRFLFIYLYI